MSCHLALHEVCRKTAKVLYLAQFCLYQKKLENIVPLKKNVTSYSEIFDATKIERPTPFSFGQVLRALCLFISLCTPVQDNQVRANKNCDISAHFSTTKNYGILKNQ